MKRYKQDIPEGKSILPLKTSWTAGAHVCWLCNKVSISKGIAGVGSSEPSSAKEMVIQDVGVGRRTVFKPNGSGQTEGHDLAVSTWSRFVFRCSNKGRDGGEIEPILCCWLMALTSSCRVNAVSSHKSTWTRKWQKTMGRSNEWANEVNF